MQQVQMQAATMKPVLMQPQPLLRPLPLPLPLLSLAIQLPASLLLRGRPDDATSLVSY